MRSCLRAGMENESRAMHDRLFHSGIIRRGANGVKGCAGSGAEAERGEGTLGSCSEERALNHDDSPLRIGLLSPSCPKGSNG